MNARMIAGLLSLSGALVLSTPALALDAAAGEALAKKEGCLKCHAVDKKKEAASLKDIAKKYAGKSNAEAKILHHVTAGEKIKLEDGTEENHKIIKTKDKGEIDNLIAWILSAK